MLREKLASSNGFESVIKVLEKKYCSDEKREKMDSMNALFRIERGRDEEIQDFVSRFDVYLRRCNAAGMTDLGDEHKGGLILGRSKLNENEEKIILGVLDGDLSYEKVTNSLIGILGRSYQHQMRERHQVA